MYPTRTTSTTGTFEVPPYPAPGAAAPAPTAAAPQRTATTASTQTEAEPATPAAAEPIWAEQVQAEPVRAEAVSAEPVRAEAVWAEPVRAEPVRGEVDRGAPASAEHVRSEPVPAEAGRAETEWDAPAQAEPEWAVPVPAAPVPAEPERVLPVPAAPFRAEPEWAVPVPAAPVPAAPVPAEPERVLPVPAAPVAFAVAPVAAEWAGAGAASSEGASVAASAPSLVAAAATEWAAPIGWALAPEQSGPVHAEAADRPAERTPGGGPDAGGLVAVGAVGAVGAAAQATAEAPYEPTGRAGEAARSDVPAARAQAEPGVDIPHPQDEAAHAGAATLRLRNLETETARPHPQDEAWPPAPAPGVHRAAAARTAPGGGAYAEVDPAPRHAGPPAVRDLPEQGGSSAEEGRATQSTVPGPAPETEYADPYPVRDLPEPGDAAPCDPVGGREPTWSVPAPGSVDDGVPGPQDAGGEAGPEAGAGAVVPGPGVVEVVARAVALMAEDDTQDLPRVAPARGVAVTEVPVHLPFRGAAQPRQPQRQHEPQQPQRPRGAAPAKARTHAPARATPGRRVPRGDDRLHEHHGPVLPGWIAVTVGGIALAGCAIVLWRAGAVPDSLAVAFGAEPRPYLGLQARFWPPLAFLGIVALLALGGLGRGRAGHAWVLTLFGRYRGTVRRSGLTWISPLLLRRRVDVRLRHWRSDPMSAVDSGGLALQVVVQVVWQVKDTARATLAVADHVDYLAEQVESAMARVLSQLPADAFHEDAPTLRDAEAVGDALTRMLAAETEAVGVEVFSAQPTRIEYAPEVADAMRRRRVAAIDAKHRDTVLTSVVDAVDDTVHRLTSRGLVELDDYERKALVKDLTVAFYTGRAE
ncbi:SPFH domain-containing protein [Streptomyces sp. H34-S4]|uniref:SPFH domain-containing protein n=1 Tax=Streptomyces sp. H34-S4 TaxID=2996463 RepID=UPI00226D7F10|nr:SPFH domain-containing protein [Streptomyces sp. H34-S4]MCY0936706.1 SPFH domain-containing protein [Streptomyces sp. H34-S4]